MKWYSIQKPNGDLIEEIRENSKQDAWYVALNIWREKAFGLSKEERRAYETTIANSSDRDKGAISFLKKLGYKCVPVKLTVAE